MFSTIQEKKHHGKIEINLKPLDPTPPATSTQTCMHEHTGSHTTTPHHCTTPLHHTTPHITPPHHTTSHHHATPHHYTTPPHSLPSFLPLLALVWPIANYNSVNASKSEIKSIRTIWFSSDETRFQVLAIELQRMALPLHFCQRKQNSPLLSP